MVHWCHTATKTNLQLTIEAIVSHQYDYLTGDERALKPMILKDIADKINMDILRFLALLTVSTLTLPTEQSF